MPKKILVMYSNEAASSGHLERLGALASDWEVVAARNAKMAVEHAPDVQIILGHRYLRQVLRHSSKIKWVQSTAAGIEHLIDDRLLKFAPMLSRCPIFSETIALHALTLAMAVTRRIPAAVLAQAERRWLSQSEILPIDQPHTAMVIGMGGIGQELGKRLKAQTIHVIGVTKNTTPPTDCFDELIFASAWKNRLPEVDWCFLAIPESPDNHRFFDQVAIESLHARAVLVNVGRASTLDQQALLRALQSNKLGGAALDVVDDPPPGREDGLWRTPNLLLTPKLSVFSENRQSMLEAFIEQQLTAFLNGRIPKFLVNYVGGD